MLHWLLQEETSQQLTGEYHVVLNSGAFRSDQLPNVENERRNPPPPLMVPSPPDTSNSNSSGFLNLLYEMYGFQLQSAEASNIVAKELR